MSSIKKNILAVALVAGLGLAGTAAAYNYGTAAFAPSATTGDTSATSPAGILVPENVAYQQLFAAQFNYTMTEDLVFDIQVPDNAVQVTTGFTVRVRLNRNACTPVTLPPGSPVPSVDATCSDTTDGALFDTTNIPTPGTGAGQLELNANLVAAGWRVEFDGYYDAGRTASIRIIPSNVIGNAANPGPGEMLRWHNARLTSLNEFAAGTTNKVDAEFWMVNASNDARFTGSTQNRTILNRVTGVTACATRVGADTDKYIDVADSWTTDMMPKSRFSFDGRLGSAENDVGNNEQLIDLGDVTITNNGAGSFAFLGTDAFHTEIVAGGGDNWLAFDNGDPALYNDDVFLSDGSCVSGTFVTRGEVNGNVVYFDYTGAQAGLSTSTGVSTRLLTVCGFVDSDTVIDDHNNVVTTSFTRVGNAVPTPIFNDPSCTLLPLRYNGSTMEIFTINPGSNDTQRSFIRLTNRSATDGHVSLVGINNLGAEGASQVRVFVPAGASVQMDAADLENGTNGAIGAWGAMATGGGKWRAIVTAEFPGLVATSLVNSALPRVLTNITDSDTRGEQYWRDYEEGAFANAVGERPSDFAQETTPDFRGNGNSDGQPGGPNGNDGPAGGTTNPCGNPGYGSGTDHGSSTDTNDFSNEDGGDGSSTPCNLPTP